MIHASAVELARVTALLALSLREILSTLSMLIPASAAEHAQATALLVLFPRSNFQRQNEKRNAASERVRHFVF